MPNAPRIELYPVRQHVQMHAYGKLLVDSAEYLELRESGFLKRYDRQQADVIRGYVGFFRNQKLLPN
ncbi:MULTISPECIES: hypothetical protein [unclassified Halomonas]|uniref:hypothetical protein n=1 Tax=unclassified Halomonas TaxID=2609666 RepID=UPI0009908482|nr:MULTISPECIES: hypothetical protein [unclassified Halomonas]AQU83136.1 hypothetical protein B2G49_11525 [Halomonas sp. 'Soap Lake \